MLRTDCLAPAKDKGKAANRIAGRAKGRKLEMKHKYVCFIASAAVVGSITGALAADVGAGETVFNQKCKVCHQIGEAPRTLWGRS
jgi:cytochrome c2